MRRCACKAGQGLTAHDITRHEVDDWLDQDLRSTCVQDSLHSAAPLIAGEATGELRIVPLRLIGHGRHDMLYFAGVAGALGGGVDA